MRLRQNHLKLMKLTTYLFRHKVIGRLVTDNAFEKVEITRTLFNRCSLAELLIIEVMLNDGTIRNRLNKKLKVEQTYAENEISANSEEQELLTINI